ncbi:alcohol dehydrogenase [Ilyonectria robusta]
MEPVGTFRAAINKTPHDVVVEERPVPQLSGTQVLVKMEAVGVCASDLHLTRRSNPYLVPKGDTGGHEGVGRIASLGPDVDTKAWKKGDRVAVRWVWWVCQKCELCLSGYEALCDKRLLGSVDVNGCWAGT